MHVPISLPQWLAILSLGCFTVITLMNMNIVFLTKFLQRKMEPQQGFNVVLEII